MADQTAPPPDPKEPFGEAPKTAEGSPREMEYGQQQQPLVQNPYDQQYQQPPPGPPGGGWGAPPPPGPPGMPPPGPPGGGWGGEQGGWGQPPPPEATPGGGWGAPPPGVAPQQPQMGYGGGPEQVIAMSTVLAIKQKVSLLEAAGDLASSVPCAEACCEKENEYEVYDQQHAQMIFYAKEHSEMCGWGGRCCCNPAHELRLELSQGPGQPPVMTIERPFKCCQSCPALCDPCQQEATVQSGGQIMGGAKQPCMGGGCKPRVDAMQGSLEGSPFAYIEGPCCFFGGLTEMCCDQQFPVYDPAEQKIGQITKEKPEGFGQAVQEIMTDSDLFTLRFDNPNLPAQQKMILLSSVLLLDYMFFEQNKPWECDPIQQSCSFTCCNMYLCGSYLPCTCKCAGGESGGGED
eukprot:TRINITY_DN445_c1_g3_i1.p2 TRINITY_DN445_c1_g3~~TRINITY_DN445_c1_g3_i1.p2  ORF type:complete len:411 (+),score=159.03 TRINITY_DN445_c1_g3_i1:24-1235(+)